MNIYPIDPKYYQQQLDHKIIQFKHDLSRLNITHTLPAIAVYPSETLHYRMRAEFKIWHQGDKAHYAMHKPGVRNQPHVIDDFKVASKAINDVMPTILRAINRCSVLRKKLFQIEFLNSMKGDMLVSLIYHKPLNENWINTAKSLKDELGIHIIGRSRKQKIALDRDYVMERFNIANIDYDYRQVEGTFTQPNAGINVKIIEWALAQSHHFGSDLLELYCGNGNFTLPLAAHFNHVLATEISKTAVNSANYNIKNNNIDNITVVRMSSEDFSLAMDKARPFRRLQHIDLDSYRFSTAFVDPPRAGLDSHTLEIIRRLNKIIYISCNPMTLIENVKRLNASHKITAVAAFDQFPYTDHLEAGVILEKFSV